MPRFRPEEIVRVLNEEDVAYVVIGGYAAAVHGSNQLTRDIDITPDASAENLDRVSRALTRLNARIRLDDEDDGLPFAHDATSLAAARFWNLVTDYGDLDIALAPAGTSGYADLARSRLVVQIAGQAMPIASLADVIRSKDAANRDKDRRVLPLLRRLLDEQLDRDRRGD